MVTIKQKSCEHCGDLFSYSRSDADHCSSSCRKAASRKSATGSQPRKPLKGSQVACSGALGEACAKTDYRKPDKDYKCRPCRLKESEHNALHRFYKSRFFEQLLRDCKRAGTLEVFNTLDDVTFYRRLRKKLTKVNGYCFKELATKEQRHYEYNICHRVAVANSSSQLIGNFSEANLFIGRATLNRKYGNKQIYLHPQVNLNCLERNSLNPRYLVTARTTSEEFQRLLELRYGIESLRVWAKRVLFSPRSNVTWDNRQVEQFVHYSHIIEDAFWEDSTIPDFEQFELSKSIDERMTAIEDENTFGLYTEDACTFNDFLRQYPDFNDHLANYQFTGDIDVLMVSLLKMLD